MPAAGPLIYCIDTSSLVHAWRRAYPPKRFSGLWNAFDQRITLPNDTIAVENERFRSVDETLRVGLLQAVGLGASNQVFTSSRHRGLVSLGDRSRRSLRRGDFERGCDSSGRVRQRHLDVSGRIMTSFARQTPRTSTAPWINFREPPPFSGSLFRTLQCVPIVLRANDQAPLRVATRCHRRTTST